MQNYSLMKSEKNISIIQAYLNDCLKSGYFTFFIDGDWYALDTKQDLKAILEKIKNCSSECFKQRLDEATSYFNRKNPEPKFTIQEIKTYFQGWRTFGKDMPEEMANAISQIEDPNDGIAALTKRLKNENQTS